MEWGQGGIRGRRGGVVQAWEEVVVVSYCFILAPLQGLKAQHEVAWICDVTSYVSGTDLGSPIEAVLYPG